MSKVILVLFLLLITFIVVITILLVKKNIHKLPSTSVGGTSCWTGVGVQDCPSDEELKTTLASNINTTLCNQDGNGKWTCPDKILNKPLNGAPGKKIKDYLKCVCFGNGVCNAGECACNKDGNQGVDNSCAPAPTPAPPSAWFCTDPKTGTCKEEPIATGIQSGCASVNSSIKNGATTEEECKLSCFPKVKGKCSGDVGYCHDLPSDDNVSCGPDAKEEHRKCHKTMYKGMRCGCVASQSGAHKYGGGKVGCQGDDGFEKRDTAIVTCATGKGKVRDGGFLGMGGHVECK